MEAKQELEKMVWCFLKWLTHTNLHMEYEVEELNAASFSFIRTDKKILTNVREYGQIQMRYCLSFLGNLSIGFLMLKRLAEK